MLSKNNVEYGRNTSEIRKSAETRIKGNRKSEKPTQESIFLWIHEDMRSVMTQAYFHDKQKRVIIIFKFPVTIVVSTKGAKDI